MPPCNRNYMEETKRLQRAILEVIRRQLAENDPPETRSTLERLLAQGISEDIALDLIGRVIAAEIIDAAGGGYRYDENRYILRLQNLPELPDSITGI